MASGKKIGLFWGVNAFSVVESHQDTPVRSFRVPFHNPGIADLQSPKTQSDDIHVITLLKEALRVNKVTVTDTHLALPSKDIVIRSFIVPFLKPHEIKGVVEFEIKKYIPFNLKELAYSFHASVIMEDKVKRMRVHFVAIRREILEYYTSILKQAGLNVVFSEPAPMCLTRALIHRRHIKPDQKVAVVQTDFNDSRIIVFDGGVVQFVRDFQLFNPGLNTPDPDPEILKKKLFNEIKISLDFYMRQFKSEKVSEVVCLSFDPSQNFIDQLQLELETPVRKVDHNTMIPAPDAVDIGIVNAYGGVLTPNAKTALFNLSSQALDSKSSRLQAASRIPEEYLPAIKAGVVCAVLVLAVFFFAKFNVAQVKKQHDVLVEEQGAFLDMSVENIQQKIAENNAKLQTYKNIFRKSDMAPALVRVSKLLPPSVWLVDLSLQFVDISETAPNTPPSTGASSNSSTMTLDLGGYSYSEDSNQQFRVVYNFLNALKSDEFFGGYLKNITLASIQSEERDKETVTSFKIIGK